MERRDLIAGLLVLLLGLGARLAWGFMQHEPDARLGDQFEYLSLGRNLLHEGELKFYDPRFEQTVHAYRTPGYPVFIAVCGGNVRAIRIAQALIDLSTVLAIYLLARGFFAPRPSLVCAGLVAFNPYLIYFSALILSETLFTAMLAWGMYCLARRWTAAGLAVLALSVLVRPSAMGLVVILAVGSAWGTGRVWRRAGLAAAMVLVVLFPWAWRNAHHPQVRAWIWTTTNGGITTYDGFNDHATGESDQAVFVAGMRTLLSRMDEVERDAFLGQKAHEWIRNHPLTVLELIFRKIGRTWSPFPLSSQYGGNRLYVVVGLLFSLPFDALVLLGLWKWSMAKSAKVFLLLPAIYFTGIHGLSVGSLRYRLPVEPPMAVLAGGWAAIALGHLHGRSRRQSGRVV